MFVNKKPRLDNKTVTLANHIPSTAMSELAVGAVNMASHVLKAQQQPSKQAKTDPRKAEPK